MIATTLDASGAVIIVEEFAPGCDHVKSVEWPDLDPFTQGYVEALFSGPISVGPGAHTYNSVLGLGFADLAPEALAAILADCAENTGEFKQPRGFSEVSRNNGRHFWAFRQAGFWPDRWPRLTVSLGDDGKVRLSDQKAPGSEAPGGQENQ